MDAFLWGLSDAVQAHDAWIYGALGIAVFCGSALTSASFLPGNSLLFVAGAFAARGDLSFNVMFSTLSVCGILGYAVNYGLGADRSPDAFERPGHPFPPTHLRRAAALIERHGAKAVAAARFVHGARTLVPALAGAGGLNYRAFLRWNLLGGLLWTGTFLAAGRAFARAPWVDEHFFLVLPAAALAGILPLLCLRPAAPR